MANCALLICEDEGREEASVHQHLYLIDAEGFLFIDVRPYLNPEAGLHYDPKTGVPQRVHFDPKADAEADAKELIKIKWVDPNIGGEPFRLFRAATPRERATWLDDPRNRALYEGRTPPPADASAPVSARPARARRGAVSGLMDDPPPLKAETKDAVPA